MKNRNIILCIALALSALPCFADPVGRGEALALAGRFLRAGGSRTGDAALRVSTLTPQTKSKEEPALYIVDDPSGGFVIVSNETSAVPVLGYSYTGSVGDVEDMPPALTEWLRSMEEAILEARNGKAKAAADVSRAWEEATIATKADGYSPVQPVVELETAQWNQGYPFNALCPEIDGERAPTGCMPTATAIIMRYWKCPRKATGAYVEPYWQNLVGGLWFSEHSLPSDDVLIKRGGWYIDYDYDWDNMPLTNGEGFTDKQISAVATLMRDAGGMVGAAYTLKGTGAAHERGGVLAERLGFDKSARYIQWKMFSHEDWVRTIAEEIKECRPILMCGFNSVEGHAYVVDGIDANNYIRINWGWGGNMNGFYSLAPFGFENETRNPGYFYSMGAWTRLQPDFGSPEEPEIYVGSMWVEERRVESNIPFTIQMEWVFPSLDPTYEYMTFDDVKADCVVVFCDRDGNVKEFISDVFSYDDWYQRHTCVISQPIEIGDYLCLCYRYHDIDGWRQSLYNVESIRGIIPLKEEYPLSDVTSIYVTRNSGLVEEGVLLRDSRLMQVVTRRGCIVELWKGEELIQRDNVIPFAVQKSFFWCGTLRDGQPAFYNFFLSDIPPGKYRIVILAPVEEYEFSFEI